MSRVRMVNTGRLEAISEKIVIVTILKPNFGVDPGKIWIMGWKGQLELI
jgi:hypothetical protein